MTRPNATTLPFLLAASLSWVACSGGGGGESTPLPVAFRLDNLNVTEGAVWQLNRPVVLGFSRQVDPDSLTSNALSLVDGLGTPVAGELRFELMDTDGDGVGDTNDQTRVTFVPRTPTEPDFSDASLLPGGDYSLVLVAGANSVRSIDGEGLDEEISVSFSATSSPPFYFDAVEGPPSAVVRPSGTTSTNTTTVRLGGDSGEEIFYERDPESGAMTQEPADARLGLDLIRDPESKPIFFVRLNQSISPLPGNLASSRIGLEADIPGEGVRFWPSRATLIENQPDGGTVVRIEPRGGSLPRSGVLRPVLRQGLQDLTGEARQSDSAPFVDGLVDAPLVLGLVPEGDVIDAVIETLPAVSYTALQGAGHAVGGGPTSATATSGWFPLGAASRNALGELVPIEFRFEGIDPLTGEVPREGEQVALDAPILGPFALGAAAPDSNVESGTERLQVESASLAPWLFTIGDSPEDQYLRAPSMLIGSDVVLFNGEEERAYEITAASYDVPSQRLSIDMASNEGTASEFLSAGVGSKTAAIVARYFRLRTVDETDVLPLDTRVAFAFQGVGANSSGEPDPQLVIVDWTGDVTQLETAGGANVRFFRWRVEYEYDLSGDGLVEGEQLPFLDFIRIPFRF